MHTADQIRREFIEFFKAKGHTEVPSSPVVPHDDPTLMFTNAGMNQFKDVFLGTGSRPYRRAADTQKCIRAGGKHNDLDDVGHDTYHHTFFEMLGNWSFGDYFKKEAIGWAWELLTQVWGIDKRRLHATYFQGDEHEGLEPDAEARDLWKTITDIDPAHIHPGNKKDNFWEMGDTGPCGPCSEIHIDLTPDMSGGDLVNKGDARVMEIWNLVFIQFNRAADGKLTPLPAKHVDTGMGFERITSLLQGKKSNYDTDVFAPIFAGIQQVTGAPAYTGLLEDSNRARSASEGRADLMKDIAYRVIADHIRCLTFAITDGATPSNEGRGYVLRRILRRAVRYGRQYFNVHEPFLCKLVPVVVDAMGHAFPELKVKPQRVVDLVRDEEESFIKTLDRGIELFEEAYRNAFSMVRIPRIIEYGSPPLDDREELLRVIRDWESGKKIVVISPPVISGADAFKLHDTFGFPIDLTEVMARERSISVDVTEYERLMETARERARRASNIGRDLAIPPQYLTTQTDDHYKHELLSMVAAFLFDVHYTPSGTQLPSGATGGCLPLGLVFDKTCFYGEQGGQVGDRGSIELSSGHKYDVIDTQRTDKHIIHIVQSDDIGQAIQPGQALLNVDPVRRHLIKGNHSATHVLNWALREVLEFEGDGKVDQKGSLVDSEKTRFDFSQNKPLTPDEIAKIESLCTRQIQADYPVYTKEVGQAEARKINTLRAVFGEKYPDVVRVVSIGADIDAMIAEPEKPEWMKYSVEFCGGTHVKCTGEIGAFVLTAEESVAKGIRRVVGVSGETAQRAMDAGKHLRDWAATMRSGPEEQVAGGLAELQKKMADTEIPLRDRVALREAIAELQSIVKKQSKQQTAESSGAANAARQQLLERAEQVNGHAVIVGLMPEVPVEQIREAADWLRTQAGSAAVCLGATADGKPLLIAAMTDDLVAKGLKAGDLVKHVVPAIDGRGGGKPQLAQAGGNNADGLPAALSAALAWIKEKLS